MVMFSSLCEKHAILRTRAGAEERKCSSSEQEEITKNKKLKIKLKKTSSSSPSSSLSCTLDFFTCCLGS
jgi:uncharacterized protein YdcH (DUF465 family)